MEQSVAISEKDAKKIVEKYLAGQIKRIIEQTVLVDTGDSWRVSFSGLHAEEITVSKEGDIIFNDHGYSSSMMDV